MMLVSKPCTKCDGTGQVEDPKADVSYGDEPEQTFYPEVDCFICNGSGYVEYFEEEESDG